MEPAQPGAPSPDHSPPPPTPLPPPASPSTSRAPLQSAFSLSPPSAPESVVDFDRPSTFVLGRNGETRATTQREFVHPNLIASNSRGNGPCPCLVKFSAILFRWRRGRYGLY